MVVGTIIVHQSAAFVSVLDKPHNGAFHMVSVAKNPVLLGWKEFRRSHPIP